jgi:hypothetical protein
MVSFTTAATVSLVAFASLIEPSIQGVTALRIGAQVVGGALASGNGNNHRRDAPPAGGKDVNTQPFAQCLSDVHNDGTKLFLHKTDHSAMLTPVPESCILAANAVNKQPNIKKIEETQGKITVVGENSIKLTGVEGEVQKMLENAAKKDTGKPVGGAAAGAKPEGQPKGDATPKAN